MVLPACPIPIPAPAEIEALEEVPLRTKLVAAGTAGPMIVTDGFVDSWLRVMLFPATNPKAEDDAVFAVPEVAPPTAVVIETSVE
jgi:hypothetical protein